MFRPIVRRLHADIAEDRSQDALGSFTNSSFGTAEKGIILDDALLVYAARVRAEDLSRQVVLCGGEPARPVQWTHGISTRARWKCSG